MHSTEEGTSISNKGMASCSASLGNQRNAEEVTSCHFIQVILATAYSMFTVSVGEDVGKGELTVVSGT